jgi:hypothetical protein
MPRSTQPYRVGPRQQSQALLAMLRGRTTSGFNPKDVERGVAKMNRKTKATRAPRRSRPPRLPRATG